MQLVDYLPEGFFFGNHWKAALEESSSVIGLIKVVMSEEKASNCCTGPQNDLTSHITGRGSCARASTSPSFGK